MLPAVLIRPSAPAVPAGFADPGVVARGAAAVCWAPYRGVPHAALAPLLALLGVGPGSRFVDLGCGDGRTLEAAARLGAGAVGVESHRGLVAAARRRLRRGGLAGRARVWHAPLESVPLDGCTHAWLWLLPWAYGRLAGRLRGADPRLRACLLGVSDPPCGRLLWRWTPAALPGCPPAVVCRPGSR